MAKALHILLRTHTPALESEGCDYALVSLHPPHIEQIENRVRLARRLLKRDESFMSVEYSDLSPRYFHFFESLERLVDLCALDGGKILFPEPWYADWIPEDAYDEVEMSSMIVLPDAVYWECYPKHSSTTVQTESLQRDHLERILRRRHRRSSS